MSVMEHTPEPRLIAAAPELLEALHESLTWLTTFQAEHEIGTQGPLQHSIDKVRTVIAKAEGRQP